MILGHSLKATKLTGQIYMAILTLLLNRIAGDLSGGTILIVLRYYIRISYLDQSFLIAFFMNRKIRYVCHLRTKKFLNSFVNLHPNLLCIVYYKLFCSNYTACNLVSRSVFK